MSPSRSPRNLSDSAESIIRNAYLVGSVPADPHDVLQDISRSVSIIGRLLNGLADRTGLPGKGLGQMLIVAGSVLWGIVEISVPESTLFYLSRNWFKLAVTIGALIIVLGVATNTTGMPFIGVYLVVGVILARILSSWFHRYMDTGNVCMRRVKELVVVIVALAAVVVTAYFLLVHAQGIASALEWTSRGFTWVAQNIHLGSTHSRK